MKRKLKVAQIGLGPIGLECLKLVATRGWAQVVGAIDIHPGLIGSDLGRLLGVGTLRGLRVVGALPELNERPDIAFHTTVSRFTEAYEQIEPLVRKGINVVSSCEEMIFPRLRQPRLSNQLDKTCRRYNARVVGTGVNPGFVMDVLPLCLAGVTHNIKEIRVERVVNASTRREPLQRKIGSGMPPRKFGRLLRSGEMGHAGLKESLALLAHGLGQRINSIRESAEPVVARRDLHTRFLKVQKGQSCGLHQRVEARSDGGIRLVLDLKMFLDAEEPHDSVFINGTPPVTAFIENGIAGDSATISALVNTAPRLLRAAPGLKLLTELPIL